MGVIVGDGACGKTCLLVTFGTGKFPETYVPTVFDTFLAHLTVDNRTVQMGLWDTAGQESYSSLRPISYPNSDVILMAFSVDSRDSFENIATKWSPEVERFRPGVPRILVGLKTDLRSDERQVAEVRASGRCMVSREEGVAMARIIKAARYMEVSAKTRTGVQEVFVVAARAAVQGRLKGVGCGGNRGCVGCSVM